ncbi:unnamed protein product [Spirodela intermedia]|uniref:BHLH domain-containing protein n=1 Tax=Spirodela intermedia TaxID=51605 RepID=A0A7I8J993_SPIIN|nr:unnamed protein product [Spirodela intermedia]CAA6666003.1 unnamed protein product [Spirodela intermedia]
MNRVFQSSTAQQIMGGSPGWWNSMRPPPQQASPFLTSSSSTSAVFSQYSQQTAWHEDQDLPESWSQMLMGGLVGDEDRCNYSPFQAKKIDSLEDQQEPSENGYLYGYGNEEIPTIRSTWSHVLQVSSPRSCVTSLSSNVLDFSGSQLEGRRQQIDHSECNSTSNGKAVKKARIQPSPSTHSTFKVRKEKLGDRITALHQLVSPFGKTDTASVLLEAIGYIRFLQSQIEALCSPYLDNRSGDMRQQQSVHEESSCIFPEDPGQLLNDAGVKKRGSTEKEVEDGADLKSRGLCLVPVSCTLHVGNDNGADYWAPSLGGGFR